MPTKGEMLHTTGPSGKCPKCEVARNRLHGEKLKPVRVEVKRTADNGAVWLKRKPRFCCELIAVEWFGRLDTFTLNPGDELEIQITVHRKRR